MESIPPPLKMERQEQMRLDEHEPTTAPELSPIKKYYLKNRAKILQQKKEYYQKRKTKILENKKIYYEENKKDILKIAEEDYEKKKNENEPKPRKRKPKKHTLKIKLFFDDEIKKDEIIEILKTKLEGF